MSMLDPHESTWRSALSADSDVDVGNVGKPLYDSCQEHSNSAQTEKMNRSLNHCHCHRVSKWLYCIDSVSKEIRGHQDTYDKCTIVHDGLISSGDSRHSHWKSTGIVSQGLLVLTCPVASLPHKDPWLCIVSSRTVAALSTVSIGHSRKLVHVCAPGADGRRQSQSVLKVPFHG